MNGYDFGKGTSAHLDVYYILENGAAASMAARIMYSRSALHVYPSQPKLSGDLIFENSTIVWKPKAENGAPVLVGKWKWQEASHKFTNAELESVTIPKENGF